MLYREVLCLRSTVPRTKDGWYIMVDVFFCRVPGKAASEKQRQAKAAAKAGAGQPEVVTNTEWDVGTIPQA